MYNYFNDKFALYNSPSYHQSLNNDSSTENSEDYSDPKIEKKENIKNNNINTNIKRYFNITKDGLNVLGYNLLIDDIIIIIVAIFLMFENKKDYLLLIILGLIILDISFDSFKEINFLNYLFNPS